MNVNHCFKLHFSSVLQPRSSNIKCCANLPRLQRRRNMFVNVFLVSTVTLHSRSSEIALAGLEKYMKKKQLDPLETYVPGIILSEKQFHELGELLLVEKPQYKDARSLLRSGPVSSLRENIRAVARYANDSGDGKAAYAAVDLCLSSLVDLCLSSLEDLDSQLLNASRDASAVSVKNMKEKLGTTMDALERLLQTVPAPILEKGKAAASAFLEQSSEATQDDADITALEELLSKK